MPVHRSEHKGNFTQIDNTAIGDKRLTLQARAVLVYLLSKPDDWVYRFANVQKELGCGKSALESALKNLEEYGYLAREGQMRGPDGKMGGNVWRVYECPIDTPSPKIGKSNALNSVIPGETATGKSGNGDDQGKRYKAPGKTATGKTDDGKPATTNTYRTNMYTNQHVQGAADAPLSANFDSRLTDAFEVMEKQELYLFELTQETEDSLTRWVEKHDRGGWVDDNGCSMDDEIAYHGERVPRWVAMLCGYHESMLRRSKVYDDDLPW